MLQLLAASVRSPAFHRRMACTVWMNDQPLWDEEIEQMEHVAKLAAMAQEVEALKALAGATQATAAMTSASAKLLSSLSSDDGDGRESADGDGPRTVDDGELWEEEREAQELLREMAAWDEQVNDLRQVASRDPNLQALRSDRDDGALPPIINAG
jgi:hypothetical protein